MKPPNALFVIATTCIAASFASAQTTFFFHDGAITTGTGSIFDGAEGSISDTVGGITLTAEALLDNVSTNTDLNGTNENFGIDNPNTNASGFDDSDRFDNLGGIESMVFSFDMAGIFDSIDLRFIVDPDHEAVLSFESGNTFQLNNTEALSGQDDFDISEAFTAGQEITLSISPSASAGENFSLESFTIVVPEPRAVVLMAGCAALGFVMLQHRK